MTKTERGGLAEVERGAQGRGLGEEEEVRRALGREGHRGVAQGGSLGKVQGKV